jgi:C-terminal processing protease CtpA/Prc
VRGFFSWKKWAAIIAVTIQLFIIAAASVASQDEPVPDANIVNDEGGPASFTGSLTYTNPFFISGVTQPLVILEDQAGFIDRNDTFLFPLESQVLGQITSDFFTSPFTYSITLPIEPQGTLRDVDNDGRQNTGIMLFSIAYWNNIWGDAFLEARDLAGGGWSASYASTRISTHPDMFREVIGGRFIVYAPDEQQGFPSDFGADGLLFTEDDPIVRLPQGYAVVNLDTSPFTFDRSRHQVVDLIEPEVSALVDFSELSFTTAFDAMLEKFRAEYAFTEYKGIDWDRLRETYRPQFEEAEANSDDDAYSFALWQFLMEIPDGHIGLSPMSPFTATIQHNIAQGIGIAIQETDDGQAIVTYLVDGSPAERAGIRLGTEIIEIDNESIDTVISNTDTWQPFSTEYNLRLAQQRYAMRFDADTVVVSVTYRSTDDNSVTTVMLRPTPEIESLLNTLPQGSSELRFPVEYRILDNGFGYVAINSFLDNALLTIQLWERMIRQMKAANVPGIIIDMRRNGGGDGYLADQMSAYFFDETLTTGYQSRYNESIEEFFLNPRPRYLYPPQEDLQYHALVAVVVGPQCASACERFAYNLTLQDRAAIVGQYPTAGLGGSIEDFRMPLNMTIRFTVGRSVDIDHNIHIEGVGVAPTVRVPVTKEALLSDHDPVLEYAVSTLAGE